MASWLFWGEAGEFHRIAVGPSNNSIRREYIETISVDLPNAAFSNLPLVIMCRGLYHESIPKVEKFATQVAQILIQLIPRAHGENSSPKPHVRCHSVSIHLSESRDVVIL